MTKPRGRYQSYTADKSVPIPKVTLWRTNRSKSKKRNNIKPNDHDSTQFSELDKFHNDAMQSISLETDDPALIVFKDEETIPEEEFYDPENESENEDDNQDLTDTFTPPSISNADKPLYAGAEITLATSMILIITFAMRHALTGGALADLLTLVDLHCLTPNLCQTSLQSFKEYFKNFESPLQFHHYCESCMLYHGIDKLDVCPNCQQTSKKRLPAHFLVIPILSQLSSLFADGTLVQQIWTQKNKTNKAFDGKLKDISDGKLYRERFRPDGYFHGSTTKDMGHLHISLQLNTDGVAIFRSSSFNIWPVYFIINELPPHLRFTRNNRIFAGLWFGYSKPDFSTFMRPFAESLHELYHTGLVLDNLKIRGILLNGVFDAPARCLFQNMVQFNGFHGCPYCTAPGKTVQTSVRGHTLTYPFNKDSGNGCHEPRTHRSFTINGEEAEQNKGNVLGVKGLTWFNYLPNFDIVRGVAIDYMHCVSLGVVKMLMTLWFDKTHKNELFSINAKVKEVDERLQAIKPPNFITRLPRSLEELSHFKAAELKNFLLYYSIPCLFGLLPADQFHHFSLLVFSIYILLQQEISSEDITKCRKMLLEFVLNIPVLYGERYTTSNTHLLLHLVDKVEDLGPLWCSSCFYFEDFNGQLRRLFHGTQHIESQIAFAVQVHQRLPKMCQTLTYGSSELGFMKNLLDKSAMSSRYRTDGVTVIGAYHSRPLTPEEHRAISTTTGTFHSVSLFKRVCLCRHVIHCNQYKPAIRRDNTIVKFSGNFFGQIEIFGKVFIGCNIAEMVALVRVMEKHDTMVLDNGQLSAPNSHMVPLQPPSRHLLAVPIKEITDVCVCVAVSNTLCFVSIAPNTVEKE